MKLQQKQKNIQWSRKLTIKKKKTKDIDICMGKKSPPTKGLLTPNFGIFTIRRPNPLHVARNVVNNLIPILCIAVVWPRNKSWRPFEFRRRIYINTMPWRIRHVAIAKCRQDPTIRILLLFNLYCHNNCIQRKGKRFSFFPIAEMVDKNGFICG